MSECMHYPGIKTLCLQEVSRLGPTMYFGELALLNGEPRKASVKVCLPCTWQQALRICS